MSAVRCMLFALALFCVAPNLGVAQERLTGSDRRVLRLIVGVPVRPSGYQLHFGLEGDFGLSSLTSVVASARRWGYGSYGCLWPGPVLGESQSENRLSYACTPDGWSISGGLRATLPIAHGRAAVYSLMGEVDLGLYRYDQGQAFVTPYGGVRAGLVATLWSAVEVQLARHLIMVSSYNRSGFDPKTWQLGSWDLGFGIPLR